MDVREQRQQAENGDKLELQLLRSVRHPLGQGVEAQIDIADGKNGCDQNDADRHHQDVGVTRGRDEGGQMMRRGWVKQFAQATLSVPGNDACGKTRKY
jgi:hypothetical protein